MKLLIAEDATYKRDKIVDFFKEVNLFSVIDVAMSYSSSLKLISKVQYNLVIIDMSLPSIDKTETESGGRFRAFGGKDIIRKMKRISVNPYVIVLTQFTTFSNQGELLSIEKINDDIARLYGDHFLGAIHYDASSSEWKWQLKNVLVRVKVE